MTWLDETRMSMGKFLEHVAEEAGIGRGSYIEPVDPWPQPGDSRIRATIKVRIRYRTLLMLRLGLGLIRLGFWIMHISLRTEWTDDDKGREAGE